MVTSRDVDDTEARELTALERAIERAGTQEALANKIGVTQGLISQWLNGAVIPTKYFPLIETATGVTAHELLDGELRKLNPRRGAAHHARSI